MNLVKSFNLDVTMSVSNEKRQEHQWSLRLLLTCGIIGPLLFITVFFVAGAMRVDYSPLRHPVSSLAIGASGWVQRASFVVTGALLVAFAHGVRYVLRPSTWGALLLALVGIGLIGAGIFVADPLNGYPPGTPPLPVVRTTHGVLHDLFGIPVFLGLPIACALIGRRLRRLGERGWAAYSLVTGLAMFAVFIPARIGFSQRGLTEFAGAFQRGALIVGFIWTVLLAVHLLRLHVRNATTRATAA